MDYEQLIESKEFKAFLILNDLEIRNKPKKKDKKDDYKSKLLNELKESDFENPDYFKITMAFFELFIKNLNEKGVATTTLEKAKGSWIDDTRKIIEIDKLNMQDLRDIFVFLQDNSFWKRNILSMSKLRKQKDKLLMNARSNGGSEKQGCSFDELKDSLTNHFN